MILLLLYRLASYSEWLQTADFYGYIIGAWAGCVVVPLDWQKKWQEWPIPNVIAGLLVQGLVIVLGPWIYQLILKKQHLLSGFGGKSGVIAAIKKASSGKRSVSPKKTSATSPSKKSVRSPSPSKRASKSINLPKKCNI